MKCVESTWQFIKVPLSGGQLCMINTYGITRSLELTYVSLSRTVKDIKNKNLN